MTACTEQHLAEDATALLPVIRPRPRDGVRITALRRRRARDQGSRSPQALAGWAALIAGMALWIWSLPLADLTRLDGYGLLPALPVAWYLALALLLAAVTVTALRDAARSVLLSAQMVSIVLVVHATPALLYGMPRYTWTFKHLGVTGVILAEHAAPRSADIYFDWPGFFSAAGWLSQATGIGVSTLATWAPPFFNILFAAAVSFVARGLTKDLRVVWLTTVLFVITNWVGQDYFAPQAYAFAASLTLTGLVLRTTPLARTGSSKLLGFGRLRRLVVGRRAEARSEHRVYGVFAELALSPAKRSLIIGVLWLAIVTSHQLSPVFALMTAAAIGAARGCIRWRLLAVMLLAEAAWVALGYPYLKTHGFALFDFDPLHTSAASVISPVASLPGMQLRSHAVYALYFGLFALGVAAGVLRVRLGRFDLAPVLVAVAPVTMLAVQNYGGEGQLRIYLFALPYLAFLVAWLVTTGGSRFLRPPARVVLCTVLLYALSGPFLLAYYGQEKINRVTPADVVPVEWFYRHAAPGETLCFVAPNLPSRMTANYIDFPVRSDSDPNLLASPSFAADPSIPAAVSFLESFGGQPYLVFTPSQRAYLQYFGIISGAAYDRLESAAASSNRLRLVYRTGTSSVWQLVAG